MYNIVLFYNIKCIIKGIKDKAKDKYQLKTNKYLLNRKYLRNPIMYQFLNKILYQMIPKIHQESNLVVRKL